MEGFFVVCGSLGFFALVFGFFLAMRYLGYRETLALAEKGLVRPGGNGKGALRWGIVFAGLGLALFLGLWPLGFVVGGREGFPLGFGPWMLAGLLPLFFGLSLILIYVATADRKKAGETAAPPAQTEIMRPAAPPAPSVEESEK